MLVCNIPYRIRTWHRKDRFSKKVWVKLTADGTNIRKRIHCVVVALTLLDHLHTVGSVDGSGLSCSSCYILLLYPCTVCLVFLHSSIRRSPHWCVSWGGVIQEPEAGYVGPQLASRCWWDFPGKFLLAFKQCMKFMIWQQIFSCYQIKFSCHGNRHWCCINHLCMHLVQVHCWWMMGHLQAMVTWWCSWGWLTDNWREPSNLCITKDKEEI